MVNVMNIFEKAIKKSLTTTLIVKKKNKYLANAIEAIIAVIFINCHNISKIVQLLNFWVNNHKNT